MPKRGKSSWLSRCNSCPSAVIRAIWFKASAICTQRRLPVRRPWLGEITGGIRAARQTNLGHWTRDDIGLPDAPLRNSAGQIDRRSQKPAARGNPVGRLRYPNIRNWHDHSWINFQRVNLSAALADQRLGHHRSSRRRGSSWDRRRGRTQKTENGHPATIAATSHKTRRRWCLFALTRLWDTEDIHVITGCDRHSHPASIRRPIGLDKESALRPADCPPAARGRWIRIPNPKYKARCSCCRRQPWQKTGFACLG